MFDQIKQSLDEKGYYTGTVDEFYLNVTEYRRMAFKTRTEIYHKALAENHIKYMNCIHGRVGNLYPNELDPSQKDRRKQMIKEKGYTVDQQWSYFGGAQLQDYIKIIEKLVFPLYTDLTEENIRHNAKFTLYENEDSTDLHIDHYVPGRKCAVLLYLSELDDYNDGGGKLILTKLKDKKFLEDVPPVVPNFAIIDTEKHQLYHGVEPVKNDFKRFAFLDFVALDTELS